MNNVKLSAMNNRNENKLTSFPVKLHTGALSFSGGQVNRYAAVDFSRELPDKKARQPWCKISIGMAIGTVLWLSTVVTVMARLIDYSNSPSPSGTPPVRWPAECQVSRDANRPTLVMFAHPRCPCTRASLGELDRLMARCPGQFSAHVLFLKPAGTPEDWVKTDLWRTASVIPGVTVHCDDAGVEARRFRSETSGHTLLYSPDGRLMFQGGITVSRGHAGDNPGRASIAALLRNEVSNQIKTRVFGCSLFETDGQEGGAACKQ